MFEIGNEKIKPNKVFNKHRVFHCGADGRAAFGIPSTGVAVHRSALPLAVMIVSMMVSTSCTAIQPTGFAMSATRVIFMEAERGGAQITALNNTDNVYLVQSRVYPAAGVTGFAQDKGAAETLRTPFLVTPPLKRMGAQSRLPLRILVTPTNSLPKDRESLFFLSAKAIPSMPAPSHSGAVPAGKAPSDGAPSTSSPRVVMAMQQLIKLYYRPSGLKPRAISDDEIARLLTMSRVGNHLHVVNPTPYYITFGELKVNEKPVSPAALRVLTPPKGEQDYPLPAGVTEGTVEWRVIDEFGLLTVKQTQVLR